MMFGLRSLLLLPTFAAAQTDFGGYTVGADYVKFGDIVNDNANIATELDKTDGYAAAKTIYTDGVTATGATLQEFARGEAFTSGTTYSPYKAFESLWAANMWDKLILDSLDDNLGDYGGDAKDNFRAYGVNKGVLGACIHEALNQLDAALDAGPSAAAQNMVDKAWAVYYGSKDGGSKSAAEVTYKRELKGLPDKIPDFYTGTTLVWPRLHVPFKQAKAALAAGGDADEAFEAVQTIKKMIILTFARATIKYSHTRMKTAADYNAGYHMEGDAYYRIFAGTALSFLNNTDTAKAKLDLISAKMSYAQAKSALTEKTNHCEVKKMVEEMYVDLELDCAMVGVMASLPTDCPTDCWTNMGVEQYFYLPLSDVYDYALITKDVKKMTSQTADGDFTAATTVYTSGDATTVLKLKTIATTDHGDDAFFKAYETTFGSKTSFDDVITPALAKSGDMASKTDNFRAYVVAKCGITALNMETMTLLAKAAAAPRGDKAYDDSAPFGAAFLWDAAYATFNGVSGGKSVGGEGGGVCRKRDNDFADGVSVRDVVLKQFQLGKQALLAGSETYGGTFDQTVVDAAIAEIKRLVGITFARATIKYSSRCKDVTSGAYSAGYHAEGFCYWRGMAGYFADKTSDKATVIEIDDLLSLKKEDADIVQPALACDAKAKMEGLLTGLGVTCAELGTMTSNMHSCSTTCAENVAAAAADAEPTDARAPLAALGALITAVLFA